MSTKRTLLSGTEIWLDEEGLIHREDGPAVIWPDGSQYWWERDKLHRVGGPAVIQPNGYRAWYWHGLRHRDGGPAIIRPGGSEDDSEEWWEHGERVYPCIAAKMQRMEVVN